MGSVCSKQSSSLVLSTNQSHNAKSAPRNSVKPVDSNTCTEAANTQHVVAIETFKGIQTKELIKSSGKLNTSTVMEESNESIESKLDELEEIIGEKESEKESEKDENEADEDGEDEDEEKSKKKVPYTDEELAEFKKSKYEFLRNTVTEVFALDNYQNEGGVYDKSIRNACIRFFNSYVSLKRASREEIYKYRVECADIMIETKIVDLFCDIIAYTYKNGWVDEEGKKNDLKYAPLSKSLLILLNFSDCSDALTVYLSNKEGFLELMTDILNGYRDRHLKVIEPPLKGTETNTLYSTLSIIHNLSMRESNIGRLRSQDLVNTLQPYLESSKDMYRLNTLASLAGIINEEECEIINTNKNLVMFLMLVLKNGLKDKRHRHRGWSCKESAFTIRSLARNDANKKLLVELFAFELLVELGNKGNIAEQYESVAAIWALCFDKDNRTLVTSKQELGVIELLVKLKLSEDADVKKACMGALWTLREDINSSPVETYRKLGEELSQKYETHKSAFKRKGKQPKQDISRRSGGHIMISYQWGHQEMLKIIRDRVKAHGYKVWMDIDQMGGSTLQAMADAVEGADIILMCMSNKYKNSPACRAEAEYAFQTRKKIIPLKMEQGYNADGWLGFILGAKLFFDFSGKYPFEDKMSGLIKEMDTAMSQINGTEVDGKVESTSSPSVHATPGSHDTRQVTPSVTTATPATSGTVHAVRKWTSEHVGKWIEKYDLKGTGLENMTGSEIAYLAKIQTDAPEFFHKFLYDTIKAKTVSAIAKIGWALHDLST
ncbi:uncharacterized protein LOC132749773 [Ruditapes philippinarum]|uniref:uncharacterized protein LOC132749773 n=1 Tax=Ruditapes philippinarum TaxID=129788 RepID=UPI00295A8B65|nr:uncharacterized protein LOC132749773 [Ruditapes philippinarum]